MAQQVVARAERTQTRVGGGPNTVEERSSGLARIASGRKLAAGVIAAGLALGAALVASPPVALAAGVPDCDRVLQGQSRALQQMEAAGGWCLASQDGIYINPVQGLLYDSESGGYYQLDPSTGDVHAVAAQAGESSRGRGSRTDGSGRRGAGGTRQALSQGDDSYGGQQCDAAMRQKAREEAARARELARDAASGNMLTSAATFSSQAVEWEYMCR